MHTLLFEVFIGVLFLPFSTSFFTAPISTLLNYNKSTIVCLGQTDTLYNGTMISQPAFDYSYTDYCIIGISTSLVNNLTQTTTYRSSISGWNMFRNMAIHQCNFPTNMDIGYGSCTPYYYQTATSIQLCVCSTNNCTATYSTCQTSVNQALSSPPPLLPVLQPSLTNAITCQDLSVNMSASNNVIPPMYSGCNFLNSFLPTDISKCYIYTPNHTVICGVFYDPIQGIYRQMAMIEGEYEQWMYQMMQVLIMVALNSSYNYQYQTSTSIAVIFPGGPGSSETGWCLCTTNNCNLDFTTCTNGMNIPSYLLAYNGSTSSTSSQSTSSGTIASSVSTTTVTVGSTSSTSTSVNTTLQLSTVTSVTTSIAVSTIGVGNNNALPSSRTSCILSNKPFYLMFLVTSFNCFISLFVAGVKYNRHLLVAVFASIIIIISSL